ncbi:UDP-forming cellulose synthase catalytic subunit [Roseomonas xinghualingensis]|uniref:UDP-forming cellulose synthase catalytic subunit n=1 Tax=Roseomonas xinghualingensis TaxID=2986475 RepID=UPI0021F1DEFE|nr:UDP-forming cellulose synthase catalytic subunit [Roseomonas sp. SXEYE001]MCV4208413.1 UDP-forming cellulose synthase catalytic subunit [Roseomonas sp. SXEYE001]
MTAIRMTATAERLPPLGRALRIASILLGVLAYLFVITVPLNGEQQAVLTLLGIAAFLVINRFKSRRATVLLVLLSFAITSRYLWWRVTETLEFDTFLQGFFSLGLFAAECYAGSLLFLSYVQLTYPLNRKPTALPPDPDEWPSVDVYVPTYNENLEIVRPTVLACMNIDWPRDKLNVYVLDDGRRPEFRQFCEEVGCGYIVRPDNKGAKAGNLNHALKHTDGEYIAIFDCDHAPTRAFLQMTVGWLVRDKRISLVQTPHYFYSPDPFERNLARQRQVPNEGLLFYGAIQPGNDLWNASFFCGSCAIIRRTALLEVGGVPHQTVTEDCHCSLLMQQKGWHTAYIRLPLAAGLATERLSIHIGQRMRWARGMIQILRQENTPFAPGLTWAQRLCYFTAGFSFLFSLPRIVFLTSPLAFLFLGQNIIAASPLAIIAYAGSHMFHAFGTASRLNGRNRHSFWSEIYEACMAAPLVLVTLATLWDPRKGKFNVTDKGGRLEEGYLDVRAVLPNLILLGALITGACIGIYGTLTNETGSLEFQAYLLNTLWCTLCLVPVSAAVAVGLEREQMRDRARVEVNLPAELILSNGQRVSAHSSDISMSGARLLLERPLGIADGDHCQVCFDLGGEHVEVNATLLHWEDREAFLRFHIENVVDEAAMVRVFFGRPDAWVHWDQWPKDRPLHALKDVVMATKDAVFRKYRFKMTKAPSRVSKPVPVEQIRKSDVVRPKPQLARPKETTAAAIALLALLLPGTAQAQLSSQNQAQRPGAARPDAPPAALPAVPAPGTPPTALDPPAAAPAPFATPAPAAAPAPPGSRREVRLTFRELGLAGPMQFRGISDLQGVLFGVSRDEVVTSARLTVQGGSSAALIPSLSQIAVTLNEQFVGNIALDPARQAFGPLSFDIDPVNFAETNRLNFRFAGRYATECNDPLSGLLYANLSDLSTLQMTIERLPPQRDLARLPEPLFDRRVLRRALNLPVVIPAEAGVQGLRAAAIATSWFAVQADYRGANFPVDRAVPALGNALVIAAGPDSVPGLSLPRFEGPTLAMVANPSDPYGTLLVLGGRSEQEVAQAALALAAGRGGIGGELARVSAPSLAPRQPYDAPRWLKPDGPVQIGNLVDRSELQAYGYAPGTIRVPLRTAPDLFTWANRGIPADIRFRAPNGQAVDVGASRLDVLVSENFLKSFPLGSGERIWPLNLLTGWLLPDPAVRSGRAMVPTYLLFGREELQMRFDMRPLNRGECTAVPGDIRAAIDPDSTIDLSRAWRYTRLPSLNYFASAGFPFTRMADLSGTAAVLPERPNTIETSAFLDLIGTLATNVGHPATGLTVVFPPALQTVAGQDLLVLGTLGRQPAAATLLRDSPVQVQNERLTIAAPDALTDLRALFLDRPGSEELSRASTALSELGEGVSVLVGTESPLTSGKSVVALLGATPAALSGVVATLRDPETTARVQGDLVMINGERVTGYRTGATYGVGDPPWWVLPYIWLGTSPWRVAGMMAAGALLLSIPFYWLLRRRAAVRLRARSPREH